MLRLDAMARRKVCPFGLAEWRQWQLLGMYTALCRRHQSGGVIAARMKTLLVACTPKRCLPWTIRSPARLIGAPLSASSCESSANRQWATTSPRPRQAAEVPLGMSSA